MRKTLLSLLLLLLAPTLAQAEPPVVHATLATQQTAIAPGTPFRIGVLLEPKSGWHTYWENPGDAGMATDLALTLPDGFKASGIDWPVPTRDTEGPLVIFAYNGPVFLPVTITPPQTLSSANYTVTVKATWLVCKDICVPEEITLSADLPVGNPAPSPQASLFSAQHPQGSLGHYHTDGKHIVLSLPLDGAQANFIPRQSNLINYSAPQILSEENGATTLTLEATDAKPQGNLSGYLLITDAQGKVTPYDVTLTQGEAAVAAASPPPQAAPQSGLFFPALLLALLGGVILNLMPCVLPVLSLKAFAIAKKAGKERDATARLGIAYTLGILLSFTVVAGILISLRQSGEAVGWGYQMQSPAFVGFLIYLLFMVGLNLSGVFELPVLFGNVGNEIAHESTARGSFFTGILATAVATPCTAPFMASAIGVALTLPPLQSLLIFEALGLGLALPFLLISLFPRCLRFLPKPGAWMVRLRQLLAFPMYASVIWLLWVLTLQTGAGGIVVALGTMLLAVLVIWMKDLFGDSHAYRVVALLLYAGLLALSLPMLSRMEIATAAMPGGDMHGAEIIDYSPQKLAELHAKGTPVYVDATAAWCITCQVNARVALHTARTMEAFTKNGVVLMIADWTRRNDDITALLSGFGFKGVPLNVFYPAQGDPVVLPQILTEDTVINAIERK